MQEFELIAKTFQGLEEVLAGELTRLGANLFFRTTTVLIFLFSFGTAPVSYDIAF